MATWSSQLVARAPAIAGGLALDVVSILVFAAAGRRNHDEGSGAGAVAATAGPFLIALAIGWAAMIALAQWRPRLGDPGTVRVGAVVWSITVTVGLLGRRALWGRGTALAFVVVAALFLAATLLGWRAVTTAVRARRAPG